MTTEQQAAAMHCLHTSNHFLGRPVVEKCTIAPIMALWVVPAVCGQMAMNEMWQG